jgi:hypothetical protein
MESSCRWDCGWGWGWEGGEEGAIGAVAAAVPTPKALAKGESAKTFSSSHTEVAKGKMSVNGRISFPNSTAPTELELN